MKSKRRTGSGCRGSWVQGSRFRVPGSGFRKPTVMPLLTDARAFVVEVPNTSGRPLHVETFGRCQMRIDGTEVAKTNPSGSGAGITVDPGASWREIVRLVDVPVTGRRIPNPAPSLIVGNQALVVHLATGRHTVAFACGGDWSAEVAFYWIAEPRNAEPRTAEPRNREP